VNEKANVSTRVSGSRPHLEIEISLGLSTSYLFAGGMHYLMHTHNAFWVTKLTIAIDIHMVCCSLFVASFDDIINLLLFLYLTDFVFVLLDWMTKGTNSSWRNWSKWLYLWHSCNMHWVTGWHINYSTSCWKPCTLFFVHVWTRNYLCIVCKLYVGNNYFKVNDLCWLYQLSE